jgi:hypothetical protein
MTDDTALTDIEAKALLKRLSKHYGEPVLPIGHYCDALRTWEHALRERAKRGAGTPREKSDLELTQQVSNVFLQIRKSNLLARLFYGGEKLRSEMCPTHKGEWGGLETSENQCPHGCQLTGWIAEPDPIDFKVYYSVDSLEDVSKASIFLAGPTPRSEAVPSWRPEALQILKKMGFRGQVIVPEPSDGKWVDDYSKQAEWEWGGLRRAGVIVFWIPRDMDTLPGMTTNIEWGLWGQHGKCVLGAPPDAPHMKYMDWMAKKTNTPRTTTLEETLQTAVTMLRRGGLIR